MRTLEEIRNANRSNASPLNKTVMPIPLTPEQYVAGKKIKNQVLYRIIIG